MSMCNVARVFSPAFTLTAEHAERAEILGENFLCGLGGLGG